jgi:hypothetical protein
VQVLRMRELAGKPEDGPSAGDTEAVWSIRTPSRDKLWTSALYQQAVPSEIVPVAFE